MNDEQNERLKQIREAAKYGGVTPNDVDFLLSLVDSQVAEMPAGWIMASVQPDRPQNVLITFENSQQASAFMSNLEPCPDAATLMRSACIETVRNHFGWGPHVRPILIEALESTTIQEQEKHR